MTVRVAVLGLERVGISAAMALNSNHNEIQCKGWDNDPKRLAAGERSKAFQHISKNLKEVIEDAAVLLITLPLQAFQAILPELKSSLKAETALVNFSREHVLPARLAQEALGAGARFVSILPALNPDLLNEAADGVDEARDDLFSKGSIYISASPKTDAAVLDLAVDLGVLLGGMPIFADAEEVEGLAAANLLLPELAGAALMAAVGRQPSWKDGRQLAGRALMQASAPLAEMAFNKITGNALSNRANSVRLLDNLTSVLQQMKGALQNDDPAALENLLAEGLDARLDWLKNRAAQTPSREKSGGSLIVKQALERFLKLGN